MVILHIACLDEILGGVNTVVPQHVSEEGKLATTFLYNVYKRSREELSGFDLLTAVNGQKPDIIIFHEVYRPPFIGLYKKALALGIPYVIIPHGSLTQESQHKKYIKKKTANILLFNRFIRGAAAVQCLSQNEFDHTRVPVEKFISTNGVRIDRIKQSFRTEKLRFLYVGRLEIAIKGIDLMLNAVKLTEHEMLESKSRLDIYGPDDIGSHEQITAMIRALGLENIVTLHGPVVGAEKADVMTGADVFIQTSRTEGMSVGLLEALAAGLPVIATEGTGMKELIDRYNAGYSAACSAESIARMIAAAVREPEALPQKGEGARRLIAENFSWDIIAPECVERYRRLASKHP